MKILSLTVFFLFIAFSAGSQTIIKGSVSDEVTGEKLIKATVKVIDQKIGVYTDSTGNFILPELLNGILTIEFSMIGYMPFRTSIKCDTLIEPLRIKLAPAKIYVD